MASMPQGMFAARKVRDNMSSTWQRNMFTSRPQERKEPLQQEKAGGQWNKPNNNGGGRDWAGFPKLNQQHLFTVMDHPPARYNSKLMNSIWGLYNRYSVHNFKKITGDVAVCFGQQQPELMIEPGCPGVAVSMPPARAGGSGVGGGAASMGAKPAPTAWESFLASAY